jgi:2-oxoisovalerate dehydrogenase E2 component (dihydrolipoyl transacylase)
LVDIDVVEDGSEAVPEPVKEQQQEIIDSVVEEGSAKAGLSALEVVESSGPETYHATLATPAVRRICREMNISIGDVDGTGRSGRVLKEDVVNHIKKNGDNEKAVAQSEVKPSIASETISQLTPIQKQMFKTMTNSLSIPHFLYSDEVEIDRLIAVRRIINGELSRSADLAKMSFMPFFIKALSLALNKFPILNSRISFENGKPMLVNRPNHNIGIAMDTPLGLIVPNIKNVQTLSIIEIAQDLSRLQRLGSEGKLSTSDLRDKTITISNIGTVGGTYVSPVIVDSEVAIVGLGKAKKLPRFDEEMNIIPSTIMKASWCGDHRVIDGMTMARMADTWKKYVEEPEKMLIHMK